MEYTINGTDFQSYDSSVGTSIDELDALYYFQSYDSSVGTCNLCLGDIDSNFNPMLVRLYRFVINSVEDQKE